MIHRCRRPGSPGPLRAAAPARGRGGAPEPRAGVRVPARPPAPRTAVVGRLVRPAEVVRPELRCTDDGVRDVVPDDGREVLTPRV
ncbi:hypothetical protein, partial [Isoptericola sp. NPDC057191]|uniref:hypothetical protein n=1 Tax=Isoptericola sp. NPDC057191 TaxID=3346041 RepID=UPI00363F5445